MTAGSDGGGKGIPDEAGMADPERGKKTGALAPMAVMVALAVAMTSRRRL